MNTYRIRRTIPPTTVPEATETRGVVGAIGKKLLKVLVFPLVDPIIGVAAERYAKHWEARNRPYALRSFLPESFRPVKDFFNKFGLMIALLLIYFGIISYVLMPE